MNGSEEIWQTPRFLWLDPWRHAPQGHEGSLRPHEPIGYHKVLLHPDAKGWYCGLSILEDKCQGVVPSISLELRVTDQAAMTDVIELLARVAGVLQANPSLITQAVGPFPRTVAVPLPDISGADEHL
jgi:hypothetical protein